MILFRPAAIERSKNARDIQPKANTYQSRSTIGKVKRIALFFATCLTAVLPATGITFRVNHTADEADIAPGNGVCMAASGTCTLRAAVMEANATAISDTILIPKGVYVLKLGELDIARPATIQGIGPKDTVIDGGSSSGAGKGFRVFDVAAGQAVQIRSLTVRNGYVANNGESGGCIRNTGRLTLTTAVVTGCRTQCSDADGSDPICNGGGIANAGTLTVQSSQIRNNFTSLATYHGSAQGGGIYNDIAGRVIVNNSLISGNWSWFEALFMGGGIYNRGYLEVKTAPSTPTRRSPGQRSRTARAPPPSSHEAHLREIPPPFTEAMPRSATLEP